MNIIISAKSTLRPMCGKQAKSYVLPESSIGEMLEVEPAFLYKQMGNFLNLTKLGASTWEEVRLCS